LKQDEYRVAPLAGRGRGADAARHKVLVERGAAGWQRASPTSWYRSNGRKSSNRPPPLYGQAELVIKVKEPQPREYPLLRRGQMLFTYFHFAADESLTKIACWRRAISARRYETLRGKHGEFALPHVPDLSESGRPQ